jgi:hypothetical protein
VLTGAGHLCPAFLEKTVSPFIITCDVAQVKGNFQKKIKNIFKKSIDFFGDMVYNNKCQVEVIQRQRTLKNK